MSGIAGIIYFDGRPVERGLIEQMTSAMSYRGPDGIDHWVNGPVALGQCMLRTTPESLEETQPLANGDASLVLVMDGRVDNWEELRKELLGRGAVLRTRADAELVLRAYETWGEQCPDRIIGEFAFFIWDARQRRLFGARDAAGTRHFFYHAGNGWFGFASEIKALLALQRIEPRLNESRLLDYLVVEFDRDDEVGTFYQDIHRLPAGHAISVTERGARTWRYWEPGNLPPAQFASLDECAEAFREQLRTAVKCRLRSIGPVGAMLSGGLDSSSIVGLIRHEFRDELQQPLRTFSLIREDRENCPDWKSIEEMLKGGWLEPTIITSAAGRDAARTFFDNIQDIDEPFTLSHGFSNTMVYEAARQQGCRVVLEGMAGDMLFYGFDRSMSAALRAGMLSQVPALLGAWRRHGIEGGPQALARSALAALAPEPVRATYRKLRGKRGFWSDDLKLLHHETARQLLAARLRERQRTRYLPGRSSDQAAHALHFTRGMLSFAHEVYGQIALSRGVQPRSPLSDRRMLEFAIRMPVQAKLAAPWYKHLIRLSIAGILPEAVRWRQDVGNHPGWKFHEELIRALATTQPDTWKLERVAYFLGLWVDAVSVEPAWLRFERDPDYATGALLHPLVIASTWMQAHIPLRSLDRVIPFSTP